VAVFAPITSTDEHSPHDRIYERHGADVTIAAMPVLGKTSLAAEFGVIEAAPAWAILGFTKSKPPPQRCQARRSRCMPRWNYLFSADPAPEIHADAQRHDSTMTLAAIYWPALLGRVPMYAYDFQAHRVPANRVTSPAIGETSAPSTRITKPIWICVALRPALICI